MKMSELILAIGDDNLTFQNLLNDVTNISTHKSGVKITFWTDPDNISPGELLSGTHKKVALLLWLPRDLVDAAIRKAKP